MTKFFLITAGIIMLCGISSLIGAWFAGRSLSADLNKDRETEYRVQPDWMKEDK